MPILPINWLNMLKFSAVDPYGPELHTLANAASDPNGNEANATTGWSAVNNAVLTSVGSPVSVGSYALYIENDSVPDAGGAMYIDLNAAPFSLLNGENIRLTFDWRHNGTPGSDSWRANRASAPDGFNFDIDTVTNGEVTYQSIIEDFVHNDGAGRYLNFRGWSGTNSNGGAYIDNISIKRLL